MFRRALIVVLYLSSQASAQSVIPAGTPLEVRLTAPLSTQQSKKGAQVQAILAAPLMLGGRVLAPLGSALQGEVTKVDRVGIGVVHEASSIALRLDRLLLTDGTSIPLSSKVAQIENSRERVDRKGSIRGVRSTSTLSHKVAGGIGTLALSNPVALLFVTASAASLLRFSDPEITLPVGTELILVATTPLQIPTDQGFPLVAPLSRTADDQRSLLALLRTQPYRTETSPKHVPSDITNLVLVGSEQSLLKALEASGWNEVDSLDAGSTYRTVRSISESQAYRTAPMSTLLLEGQRPAHAMAKTFDTFSKRHHLRIFATSDRWNGQLVWLASATQDIGIGFSRSQKTFIHQIDRNIDHERSKVANDLLLTGCVAGMSLVERPWLAKSLTNGTGEQIETDRKQAVLLLDDCAQPRYLEKPSSVQQSTPKTNPFADAARQTNLTLRNTLLRDNLAVTAYGGISEALKFKRAQPPEQPLATESSLNAPSYLIRAPDEQSMGGLVKRPVGSSRDEDAPVPQRPAHARARWSPYTVEIGLHSGWAGYAGGNGAGVGFLFAASDPMSTDPFDLLVLANHHESGFNIGSSVTLDAHRHFSHEISFDYNRTPFTVGFAALPIMGSGETTDAETQTEFVFQEATLSTTEAAYNLQFHPARLSSRWQPYITAGPSLRLLHLTDSPIKHASKWFQLGLSNVGAVVAAYQFGSTPPLEGGGIFQLGLQYGGGIKYRVSQRFLVRTEYKETLTSQPDFWSASKDDIFTPENYPGYKLTIVGPIINSAMRQQRATAGVSFIF